MERLIGAIDFLLLLMMIAIVGRALMSFVVPMAGARPHPVLLNLNMLLGQATEPILGPLRRMLPTVGTLDLSPMVAIIGLGIIRWALSNA